jgi:hypothetical protein
MSPIESSDLAEYINAHFPQQPIANLTAEALLELLHAYPMSDCRQAVLNIAERGEHWCPPTAVKAEVKNIRAKRIAEHPPVEPPPGLVDKPAELIAWQRGLSQRIGDGQTFDPNHFYAGQLVDRSSEIRELMAASKETP